MSEETEQLRDAVMGWPDISHADALYAQAQGVVSTEERHAYLAGIGTLWPIIRPALTALLLGTPEKQNGDRP